ncbi:MAG: hypothetical protein IJV37_09540 [Bacteroidales bacterium]|nr:hypothetical protein [Bacteroidales bacterium]
MREHFSLSKTPVVPWRTGLREGIFPLAGILGITIGLVAVFYLFLHLGARMAPVVQPHVDDGELVDPNPLRLVFVLAGFVASLVFFRYAELAGNQGRIWPAFWLGYAGGTLIWQSVGEASWHFGLPSEDFLICFVHLESSASLWLVLMTTALLVYCAHRRAFGWGAWVFILSFVGNWFGHFVQIGTFPLVSRLMEEGDWYVITGTAVGIPVCLLALWLNFFAARTTKARLCCCLLLYFGIGIIVTGVGGL